VTTLTDVHSSRITSDTSTAAFMELVSARDGHFRLESGYHTTLWLELDALFAEPRAIAPFVAALSDRIRPHDVSVVCGPLLGGAFLAQLVAHALDIEFCFTERVTPTDTGGLYGIRYVLPPSFRERVWEKRIAIVDDVMSAGSALRGTFTELNTHGATTVVAGALLVSGTRGVEFFSEQGVAVESVCTERLDLWLPDECPRCTAGERVEDITDAPIRGSQF
jgi:orotate phosphoribosyltransferase